MQIVSLGEGCSTSTSAPFLGRRERPFVFRVKRARLVAQTTAQCRPGEERRDRTPLPASSFAGAVSQDNVLPDVPGPLLNEDRMTSVEEWDQFQSLCSGALEMLELVVKLKGRWRRIYAAVYCRIPETYETGELRFQLAHNMELLGGDSRTEINSSLSLGHEEAQDFLLRNEFLELPQNGCSVFPLTQGTRVAGLLLLVLEREEINASKEEILAMRGHDMGVMQTISTSFIEKDLDGLRPVKKILASACDLYQTSVLVRASASARNQFANGLLRETKGPVKMVRSMANMLHYRVPSGKPESDMVQSIQDQGARLSEVVKQLETALHLPSASESEPISKSLSGNMEAQDSISCLSDSTGINR